MSLRSPQANAFKCIPCDTRTLSFSMGPKLIARPRIVQGVVSLSKPRFFKNCCEAWSNSGSRESSSGVSRSCLLPITQTSGPRESSPEVSRSSQKLLSASIVRQPASLRRSLSMSVGVTLPNQQCRLSISAARAPRN